MDLVAYTNTGAHNVHIGGKLIRPGQTREIEATLDPDYHAPPAEETEQTDPVAKLLEGTIAEVRDGLADLCEAELERAEQLEEAGENRKGVHEALETERLRRAAAEDQ